MGVCDPELANQGVAFWRDVKVLGDDNALERFDIESIGLVNGVGQVVGSNIRQMVFEKQTSRGFHFPPLVHPTAWVDPTADLSEGVQVMASVVIQADASIGPNCIINTNSSVDHDCRLDGHTHVAPGATICGNVRIEAGVFIGCGANVIQGLHISHDAVVGAGVTLTRNLPAYQILLGPAVRKK
ncbi:UDP-N-acetylbacillosamine N-acetyltransferase [compost metagenome]